MGLGEWKADAAALLSSWQSQTTKLSCAAPQMLSSSKAHNTSLFTERNIKGG